MRTLVAITSMLTMSFWLSLTHDRSITKKLMKGSWRTLPLKTEKNASETVNVSNRAMIREELQGIIGKCRGGNRWRNSMLKRKRSKELSKQSTRSEKRQVTVLVTIQSMASTIAMRKVYKFRTQTCKKKWDRSLEPRIWTLLVIRLTIQSMELIQLLSLSYLRLEEVSLVLEHLHHTVQWQTPTYRSKAWVMERALFMR